MIMFQLFELKGPQWKGQLHAHTTLSDGGFEPADLVHRYYYRGYDFLAITDHDMWHDHSGLSTDDFTVLSGNEVSGSAAHILVLRMESSHLDGSLSTHETIDAINEAGGISCLNHVQET